MVKAFINHLSAARDKYLILFVEFYGVTAEAMHLCDTETKCCGFMLIVSGSPRRLERYVFF